MSLCASCRTVLRASFKRKLNALQEFRRSNSTQSLYSDSTKPTEQSLKVANWFFKQHRPEKIWTATEWRKNNNEESEALAAEVAVLGRSNVGKSSLLNAVLNSPGLNYTGSRPGKTNVLHAWGLSATDAKGGALKGWKGLTDTRLAVVDAPGYGHGSVKDWGNEILAYVKQRKQLRRIFVLVDSLHGLKLSDKFVLEHLALTNVPHQLIACKIDRQPDLEKAMRNIRDAAQPKDDRTLTMLGEILVAGGLEKSNTGTGIDAIRHAMLQATGLEEFASESYNRLHGLENKSKPSEVHKSSPQPQTVTQTFPGPSHSALVGSLLGSSGRNSTPSADSYTQWDSRQRTTYEPMTRPWPTSPTVTTKVADKPTAPTKVANKPPTTPATAQQTPSPPPARSNHTVLSGLAALEEAVGLKKPPVSKNASTKKQNSRSGAQKQKPRKATTAAAAKSQPASRSAPDPFAASSGMAALEALAGIGQKQQGGGGGGLPRKRRRR